MSYRSEGDEEQRYEIPMPATFAPLFNKEINRMTLNTTLENELFCQEAYYKFTFRLVERKRASGIIRSK